MHLLRIDRLVLDFDARPISPQAVRYLRVYKGFTLKYVGSFFGVTPSRIREVEVRYAHVMGRRGFDYAEGKLK